MSCCGSCSRNPKRKRNGTLQVVLPNSHGSRSKLRQPKMRKATRALRRSVRQQERLVAWSKKNRTATAGFESRVLVAMRRDLMDRRRKNPAIRGYAARGGARVRGGQNLSAPRFVAASYARTFPGFAKALAGFKKFHGYAPSHFTTTRIKTSGSANTRRAVFMVGEAPAIEYRTWRYARSKKSHTKDGRRILWRHKMGELGGKVPYWVHDPVSGVTSALGGTYKVDDFYRH